MLWLLDPSVVAVFQQVMRTGFNPTMAQQVAFASYGQAVVAGDTSRILKVAGGIAQISIDGVITDKPDFMAMLFGGGNLTFREIDAAVAAAEADNEVSEILLDVGNGPGSTVDGLFNTVEVLRNARKPIRARVRNAALSGTFGLVTQALTIQATNAAARFGNVGVAADLRLFEGDVSIASTKAPKKRPDLKTKAGRAVMREELDAIHGLFAGLIGEGRGVTTDVVNSTFGEGATLIAGDALARNMIDSISTGARVPSVPASPQSKAKSKQGGLMDLNELRMQHPATYAAAVEEGRVVGQTTERERVQGFVAWGEQSGNTTLALDGIKSERQVSEADRAAFTMHGVNSRDQQNRGDDNASAAAAEGGDLGGQDVTDAQKDKIVAQNILKGAGHSGLLNSTLELGELS